MEFLFFINSRSIKVWSMETYDLLHILRGHEDEVEVQYSFYLLKNYKN